MISVARKRRFALSAQARFMLLFCGSAGLLLLIYCFPYKESGFSERGFELFLAGYARAAHAVIVKFDPSAIVIGNQIHGRFAISIVKGCDAMEIEILFAAAMLAYPAPWSKKLPLVTCGVLALAVLNVIRITTLYLVGAARPTLVETLHLETWPFVMVTLAVLLFLGCVTLMNGGEARPVDVEP